MPARWATPSALLNVESKRVVQARDFRAGPHHRSPASSSEHPPCRHRSRSPERREYGSESSKAERVLCRNRGLLFALRAAVARSPCVAAPAAPTIDQLKQLGEPPPLSPMENPTTKPGYKPVQMPMPSPQPASYNPNSLWRNGSRAFFKDQRAHQIGDILTVKVNINDTAQFQDQTQLTRTARKIPASPISSAPTPSATRPPRCCRARF